MIKKITEIFLITITQVLCVVFINNVLNSYYPIQHKEVGFGITAYCSFLIFTFSLLVCNYYVEFFTKRKLIIVFGLILLTIYLPLEALSFRPFRSTLLITLYILGFISTTLITKRRKQNPSIKTPIAKTYG
ncbi:hypothetical protein BJQ96_01052 [Flavobacterium sp. PL0002]|nr:hypothetical protein [Flavobacterium sp. PL002]